MARDSRIPSRRDGGRAAFAGLILLLLAWCVPAAGVAEAAAVTAAALARPAAALAVVRVAAAASTSPFPAASDPTPVRRKVGPPWAILRAEAKMEGSVDAVAALWPEVSREISAGLGLSDPAPVEIVLLRGKTFRPWARKLIPEWGVGFANWPAGPIVLDMDAVTRGQKGLPRILRHELSHVYLGQRVGAHAGLPRWFVEGVAQAQSGEWKWLDGFALLRGASAGELPSLEQIGRAFPAGGQAARRAYAISLAAVLRLQDRLRAHGGWRALIDATAAQGRFDLAFRQLTGETLHRFALDFDRRMQSRYGWIAALSQVASIFTVMTVLFLAGYARTVYRKRKRLAEMEREEREPPPPWKLD